MNEFDLPNDPPGTVDLISQGLGERGRLTRRTAKRAAKFWKECLRLQPKAHVILHIGGYDDDPRALWEFDEVRTFVQQFARFAGIADAMDYFDRLDSSGVAFLAACGVPCSEKVVLAPPTTEH
jgi:hypothetical protein